MTDHSMMHLGKSEARHDPRTLVLASYISSALPPAPAAFGYSHYVSTWPMYGNDQIGDCTIAGAGHLIQCWTAAGKHAEITIAQSDVIAAYEAIGGYNPADPTTDEGAVELDVLRYWRTHGIGGHKIGAYMSVSPQSTALVKDAIYLFGGIYIGLELPVSAQTQTVWDVPPGGARGPGKPGSWGGHCVIITDYDARGLTCVTWGATKRITWAFLRAYCSEAYAILSRDFLLAGMAPNGFELAELQRDLVML